MIKESNKPRAVLISFFNSGNIGDLLISQILYDSFSRKFVVVSIDFNDVVCKGFQDSQTSNSENVGSDRYKYLKNLYALIRNLLSMKWNTVNDEIKKSQFVFIGGGNMIMDLQTVPLYTYNFTRYVNIAKKNRKPVFTFSVGVGPLQTKFQKWIVKKALNNCIYHSFRDIQSIELCREMGLNKEGALTCDPVFLFKKGKSSDKKTIGISILSYYDFLDFNDYEDYISNFALCVEKIRDKYPYFKITLFSTEINDYPTVYDVYRRLNNSFNIQYIEFDEVKAMPLIYESMVMLIGTRMHSIILAMTQHVPVIGLSWQSKVNGLFEMYSKDKLLKIGIIKTEQKDILDMIDKIINNYDEERQKIESFVNWNIQRFTTGIDQISKLSIGEMK